MFAICTIRTNVHYRHEAFINGLKRAGYILADQGRPKDKRDLFITWNRYGFNEERANNWENDGGSVLVAENGYIGADPLGRQYYALALHGHNGSGWVPMYSEDRFAMLGIELQPWVDRPNGYDLICGQRGIGSKEMRSPDNWHVQAVKKTPQPDNVKIRVHPETLKNASVKPPPLEADLAGAQRCIIWSSSSGVKALVAGIPVRYDAPHWICSAAASRLSTEGTIYPNGYDVTGTGMDGDDGQRKYAMTVMANAQYSVEELESGAPFATFRDCAETATW
jgi:hypothetical protein